MHRVQRDRTLSVQSEAGLVFRATPGGMKNAAGMDGCETHVVFRCCVVVDRLVDWREKTRRGMKCPLGLHIFRLPIKIWDKTQVLTVLQVMVRK